MPTIGIVKELQPNSGSLIVMTDSDCIDSSSVGYRGTQAKCFWLMQKFADIATGKLDHDFLLKNEYKLPHDFTSKNYYEENSVLKVTLEDLNNQPFKLNSVDQRCKNKEL